MLRNVIWETAQGWRRPSHLVARSKTATRLLSSTVHRYSSFSQVAQDSTAPTDEIASTQNTSSNATKELRRQLEAERRHEEFSQASTHTNDGASWQSQVQAEGNAFVRNFGTGRNDEHLDAVDRILGRLPNLDDLEIHKEPCNKVGPELAPSSADGLEFEAKLGPDIQDRDGWYSNRTLRRKVERRLQLSRSWQKISPSLALKRLLVSQPNDHETRRQTAMARSIRMPIVLLQMMIRDQERLKPEGSELLALLPDEEAWQRIMDVYGRIGHSEENLRSYLEILTARTDKERCERFLKDDSFKPIWLLNFLIRGSSRITADNLADLMSHFRKTYMSKTQEKLEDPTFRRPQKLSLMPVLNMNPQAFIHAMKGFSHHCMRLDPRLLVKLANLISRYIKDLRFCPERPRLLYHRQCSIFNTALELFQPNPHLLAHRRLLPNAYLWEAQRILLDTSGGLPQPLLLTRDGFRAIRGVLAGLRKNWAESHTVGRHLDTWPPYLRPGDGMDERMDPEESWSRTVRAGMMMQEAGFPKDESDEVLDILQGFAPDGTPTIQQRISVLPRQKLTVWAAQIKATRNAHEAWARFQQPPRGKGYQKNPGLMEYAVMFQKIFARGAGVDTGELPGDNALSYPTPEEANLAEFERVRLAPPSADDLYQKMRLNGLRPRDECLAVLVANAGSLDTAHRYLLESDMKGGLHTNLISPSPDPELLRKLPFRLFAAYIDTCVRQSGQSMKHLTRAIQLVSLRQRKGTNHKQSFLWQPILKHVGQHHLGLGLSLEQQLRLILELLPRMQTDTGVPLTLFKYFVRCVQKILRRESQRLLEDISLAQPGDFDDLLLMYDEKSEKGRGVRQLTEEFESKKPAAQEMGMDDGLKNKSALFLCNIVALRMRSCFATLVRQDKFSRATAEGPEISPLDVMFSRRDPVTATYAYDYVLTLAYLGQYEEMANVVKWLAQEWGKPDLVRELEELDNIPHEADMFDTLCAFRAFGEPMLSNEAVNSVLDAINVTEVDWVWPDDQMVESFVNGRSDDQSHEDLGKLLSWTRERYCDGQSDEVSTETATKHSKRSWWKTKQERGSLHEPTR